MSLIQYDDPWAEERREAALDSAVVRRRRVDHHVETRAVKDFTYQKSWPKVTRIRADQRPAFDELQRAHDALHSAATALGVSGPTAHKMVAAYTAVMALPRDLKLTLLNDSMPAIQRGLTERKLPVGAQYLLTHDATRRFLKRRNEESSPVKKRQ
jgi:hypothetical protein